MKTQLKRLLSGAIALIMVLSLVSIPATALDLTLQLNGATVTVSDADQTVDITLEAPNAIEWCSVGGDISVESPLSIADIKNYNGVSIIDNDFSDPAGSTNGYLANMALGNNANVNTANLVTVTVKIPANTVAGDYEISFEGIEVCYDYGEVYTLASDSLTATITVSEAAPATQGYELYYVVDSTADTDNDKYFEYNPGDTVTVTVYLKSNLADTLQAFDFIVTNDANLTYTGLTSDNGTHIDSGNNASTATSQRIQAVGADKDHPINVALPAGTGVEIATITFTVADTAVYNTAMPITLTNAANIAVAGTPASFSPELQVSSDTLGVETLKTYTISYNDNVADEEITVPADQTKQHGVDIALDSAVPTRTGYTFAGWTKTASSTTADYAAGATFSEDADTPLYAVWTVNTHKVTWKSQDGTQTLETDENVPYGEPLSYDGTAPTKEATAQYTYTFVGWSMTVDSEVASAASPLVMLDNDMVLYAAFSKVINKYTVTWYKQDGSAAIETDENVEFGTQPSFDGSVPTKDADETYTYDFAGWATEANQEEGVAVANLPTVDGVENYYAAFSKTYIDYDITFDLGAHPASTAVAPTDPESAHYNESITLPAAPAAAEGYTFTGWSDGNGNTYAAGDPATITATTVFTAQYSENKYDVVYNANGGTGTLPANHEDVPFTQTITIGSGEGLANNGYTFIGWNTNSSATTALYSAGDTPSGLSSTDGDTVTLYAIWSEAAYVIEYNYDGGTFEDTDTNPRGYDVSDLPITLTQPTKTGYTFDSWTITVKSGEEGSVSANGDVIAAGTWGNLTVKANWTPNTNTEYTVKHRFQSLDGSAYVEDTTLVPEDDHMTGTTGQPTEAAAKTITGYTAKDFEQVAIAADGSTVIVINYDRNEHTVTYQYEQGTVVPSGAPSAPVDTNSPYKFGATVNVDQTEISVDHYDFSGWKINGADAPASFTMGDEDVVIIGSFTEHEYTIKFWNLEKDAAGNTVLSEQTYTESTQGSVTVPTVPTKEWYDANGWTAYTLFSEDVINVYPQYTEHVYTITFQDENGNNLSDQGTDNTFTITDKTITPPAVPEKPGYDGAWPTLPTDTASNASVKPVYTPHGYTITFVTDGGAEIEAMTYTIESTDTLPEATGKTNFTFVEWKVTTAGGNWAIDSTYIKETPVTGKYGDVTLTAQWTQSLNYAVQEYKYAPAGYKMLIIDAAGAGDGVYTYDGATMYYTTDSNYMIGTSDNASTAVFYTLIEADALTLTDAQVGKIATGTGDKATITYDGDINGDGKVNIADANAIFQMVVATGSYYGESQLTIAQRLAADMVKATDNAEYRGSIEDVNAVVDIINGVN